MTKQITNDVLLVVINTSHDNDHNSLIITITFNLFHDENTLHSKCDSHHCKLQAKGHHQCINDEQHFSCINSSLYAVFPI